jgi:hypothetical protein
MKKAIPMKCSSRKILLLTLLLLGKGIILHAQDELPRHEFTFKVGELVYQGDLTPEQFGAFKTRRLAWEVQFTRILTNTFSLKANVLWGNITAHDHLYKKPTWRQQRNFNFKSPLTEFSLRLQMKSRQARIRRGAIHLCFWWCWNYFS